MGALAIIRFTTKGGMQKLDALQASDPVLFGILILAVILDFRYMKISNRLIFVGIVSGLAIHIWGYGWSGIGSILWNISFPVIVLYLFYLVRAVGAGDIKLFSVVGSFFNFKELVLCIAASFLIGALFSLCKLLHSGNLILGIREGTDYLRRLAAGEHAVYERDTVHGSNVIHFSLAVLIGAAAAKIYRSLM
jgi:prepilin peptidase CpaA